MGSLSRNSGMKGERSSVAERAAESRILQCERKKPVQEERMGLQKWWGFTSQSMDPDTSS